MNKKLAKLIAEYSKLFPYPAILEPPIRYIIHPLQALMVRARIFMHRLPRPDIESYQLYRINLITGNSFSQLSQISQLPIMQRGDFKKFYEFNRNELASKGFYPNDSTGSGGNPMTFWVDPRSFLRHASALQYLLTRIHLPLNSSILFLTGANRKYYNHQGNFLPFVNLSNRNPYHIYDLLQKYRPKVLLAMLAGAIVMADFFSKYRIPYKFDAIVVTGEQMTKNQKRYLETIFSAPVYTYYSSAEIGIIGQECRYRNGIHVNEDSVLMEIVDDDMRPVPDGMEGNILISSLFNTHPPIIRYRIGDGGKFMSGQCLCGLSTKRIELYAHTADFIFLPDDRRVPFKGIFGHVIDKVGGIKNYQFIQHSLHELEIKIVPDRNIDNLAKLIERLTKETINYLDCEALNFNIVVTLVDKIDLTKSGKIIPLQTYLKVRTGGSP